VKLLLVPFAIVGFILLLIVLGAVGLGVAFVVIYVCGRLWRLVLWGSGRSRRGSAA
jgi:hypothetical protein